MFGDALNSIHFKVKIKKQIERKILSFHITKISRELISLLRCNQFSSGWLLIIVLQKTVKFVTRTLLVTTHSFQSRRAWWRLTPFLSRRLQRLQNGSNYRFVGFFYYLENSFINNYFFRLLTLYIFVCVKFLTFNGNLFIFNEIYANLWYSRKTAVFFVIINCKLPAIILLIIIVFKVINSKIIIVYYIFYHILIFCSKDFVNYIFFYYGKTFYTYYFKEKSWN